MDYNKDLVSEKLRKWETVLSMYSLPSWDSLPKLELYMDQVVLLLSEYLELLPVEENADKVVTPSIINNYVRMRVIPPPVKKRYSRVHLAYLILICTLKQNLNISYIQQILPLALEEAQVRALYDAFVQTHKKASEAFIRLVREEAKDVLDPECAQDHCVETLVMKSAISSGFCRLLTEKLIGLKRQEAPKPKASVKEALDKG